MFKRLRVFRQLFTIITYTFALYDSYIIISFGNMNYKILQRLSVSLHIIELHYYIT